MLEPVAVDGCCCSRDISSSAQYDKDHQDDQESAPARDSHLLSTTSCKRDEAQELIGCSGSSESAYRRVLLTLNDQIVVVGTEDLFECSLCARWCVGVMHSASHLQGQAVSRNLSHALVRLRLPKVIQLAWQS